jgi:hypothetical protein
MPFAERLSALLTRATVYTHLSSSRRFSAADWCFSSGKEGVSRKDVPQALIGCFGDADTGGGFDVSGVEAIVPDPQSRMRRGEIAAVVAGAGDAESFREAPWAAGQPGKIPRARDHDFSRPRHLFDADERFEGAEKNASGLPVALTRHVQAIVSAVDEVNIGVARRSEQDCSAGSVAGGGVGRGIVFSEISLDLNDAAGKVRLNAVWLKNVTDQHFAEQFASHAARFASEEGTIERAGGRRSAGNLPAVLRGCHGLVEGAAALARAGKPPGRRRYAAPFADSFR